MNIILKNLIAGSRGLKSEMAIAMGLIALVFLVFLGYLFPGFSSFFESRSSLFWVTLLVFIILALAFVIILQIVGPVLHITSEVKRIAEGDLNREIDLFRDDEIGELGAAINRMSRRMKENVEELQKFSRATEIINAEINKRIVMLSNIFQVSSLIAQNAQLKEIVEVGVGKCLASGVMNFSCLIMKDFSSSVFRVVSLSGTKAEELSGKGIRDLEIKLGEGLLGKALLKEGMIVIDSQTYLSEEVRDFKLRFSLLSAIIVPITTKGNVLGLLLAGNDTPEFAFAKSEHELVQLIARQIAIAQSNDLLRKEIEKLEVIDRLTGLFNQTFLVGRLNEEIKRAVSFQRPCSLVLMSLDRFDEFHSTFGHIAAENLLIKIGALMKESISEADKATRFSDHEFGLILPEKNKRQSIHVADNIRRKVEAMFAAELDVQKRLTATGAVTENPIDGVTAEELVSKAQAILRDAQKQGGNRICYKI